MMTENEKRALQALRRLSEGTTTFLNIPDADALVKLGLAERFGKGQYILTEQGWAMIEQETKRDTSG